MAPGVLQGEAAPDVAEARQIASKADNAAEQDVALHPTVLKTFRILIADLCQQFKGGHPG